MAHIQYLANPRPNWVALRRDWIDEIPPQVLQTTNNNKISRRSKDRKYSHKNKQRKKVLAKQKQKQLLVGGG
jgi:epoxyqueuosine reductase QueG